MLMQRPLVVQRALMRAALAFAHMFAWVFVFEYWFVLSGANWTQALIHTTYAYALAQVATILITPQSARLLGNSFKRALIYGTLANSAAFAILATVLNGSWGSLNGLGIVFFAIFLGLYRGVYWMPYSSEHSLAIREREYLERELLLALLPALAGLLLGLGIVYPSTILWTTSITILLSNIPLFFYKDHYERFSWEYLETFTHLFSRKNRHLAFRTVLVGIENSALLLLWPVTLVMIVGSHTLLGIILSISMLVVLVLKLPRASTYLTHTHHVDGERYIDEYTALREIAEATGRIILCTIVAWLAALSTFPFALLVGFTLAAIAAVIRAVRSRPV